MPRPSSRRSRYWAEQRTCSSSGWSRTSSPSRLDVFPLQGPKVSWVRALSGSGSWQRLTAGLPAPGRCGGPSSEPPVRVQQFVSSSACVTGPRAAYCLGWGGSATPDTLSEMTSPVE